MSSYSSQFLFFFPLNQAETLIYILENVADDQGFFL